MKYKTFVKLRVAVPLTVAAGSITGVVAMRSTDTTTVATRPATTAAAIRTTAPAVTRIASPARPATPSTQPSNGELSAVDREVLRLRDRPLSEGTVDGTSTKYREKFGTTVIELRSDSGKGSTIWNRAKIDLDTDKLFDEKWDFGADGTVTRKVAPNDDEAFTDTYRLTNRRWVLTARSTDNTATTIAVLDAGPGTLRSIDREVLRLQKEPIANGTSDGSSLKWRVKQGNTVIELRSDTAKGSSTWNRVKLDLDGDKRIDEKWNVRADGTIERQVSTADDDNYTETYRLEGGRWVKS